MALRLIARRIKINSPSIVNSTRAMSSEWGSGSGKGGGAGGSIREAGGSFGKMESAREEEYFRKQRKQQLEELKSHLHDEIQDHEAMIKKHQEAIERLKNKSNKLDKDH